MKCSAGRIAYYELPGLSLAEVGLARSHADSRLWRENFVRNYLDILTSTLVIRQLKPWHANISKRQVKSPKVYIRDQRFITHAIAD